MMKKMMKKMTPHEPVEKKPGKKTVGVPMNMGDPDHHMKGMMHHMKAMHKMAKMHHKKKMK